MADITKTRSLRSPKIAVLPVFAIVTALGLAGCTTGSTSDAVIRIDKAQGSQENIASLTSVINANPQDPEGYNVRGSAYGRGGDFRAMICYPAPNRKAAAARTVYFLPLAPC